MMTLIDSFPVQIVRVIGVYSTTSFDYYLLSEIKEHGRQIIFLANVNLVVK